MKNFGFTLIELLLAITLISILSFIVYPSYNKHLIRVRRIQIATVLLDLAGKMERYHAMKNTYDGADVKISSKYYEIKMESKESDQYILKAIPIGAQKKDKACASLTLDQDGRRGSDGDGSSIECWL